VRVLRGSLLAQAATIACHAPARLLIPLGTNRLLRFLETGGAGAVVRPWVWILVTGPCVCACVDAGLTSAHSGRRELCAVGDEQRVLLHGGASARCARRHALTSRRQSTAVLRTRALLTALIFDHALRVRATAAPSAAAPTAGLSARITDLATADLANVLGGAQFLLPLLDAPLELALGLAFLYALLGWAAFAGLAAMLLLLPVPAALAARMARAQARKMAATDARVGALEEGVRVLRTLKLGGGARAVRADIAQRRDAELRAEWRLKALEAAGNVASFAIPLAHLLVSFAVFVRARGVCGAWCVLMRGRRS
jgi:ABC-type multidrug transport system fused ATPase/permease subunit